MDESRAKVAGSQETETTVSTDDRASCLALSLSAGARRIDHDSIEVFELALLSNGVCTLVPPHVAGRHAGGHHDR